MTDEYTVEPNRANLAGGGWVRRNGAPFAGFSDLADAEHTARVLNAAAGSGSTGVPEPDRLRSECAVCESCGHLQGEPTWCHACGHRTRFPEWADRLLKRVHDEGRDEGYHAALEAVENGQEDPCPRCRAAGGPPTAAPKVGDRVQHVDSGRIAIVERIEDDGREALENLRLHLLGQDPCPSPMEDKP